MAVSVKKVVEKAEEPKAPPVLQQHAMDVKIWDPTSGGSARPHRLVFVVGCGGTGARLVPPLTKMLLSTDQIMCVDHDVVEARNVGRQNFSRDDIGKYKSQVMEERYHSPGDDGPNVMAVTAPFSRQIMTESVRDAVARFRNIDVTLLGCVDSIPARKEMYKASMEDMNNWRIPQLYLDSGNETRTGQVLLVHARNLITAPESMTFHLPEMTRHLMDNGVHLNIHAANTFPDLFGLVPDVESENPDAGVGCGVRMDLQTVAVNQTAATAMLNLLVPFFYPGVSLRNLGVTFSTYNTMSPILPNRVERTPNGELITCERRA